MQADLHRRCYYAKNRFSYDIAQITLSIISIFIASWLFIQTLSSKFEFQYENGGSLGVGSRGGGGKRVDYLKVCKKCFIVCSFIMMTYVGQNCFIVTLKLIAFSVIFHAFCRLLIFFKINFLKKFFQEYHQNVKQFGP